MTSNSLPDSPLSSAMPSIPRSPTTPFPPASPTSPISPASLSSPIRSIVPTTTTKGRNGPAKTGNAPKAAPQAKPLVTPIQYQISPLTLHYKHCACAAPRRELLTASEQINYTISRLDKVWRRLIGHRPPDQVKDAAYRTMVGLRSRGYEFAHLVAFEGPIKHQGAKARREYSVIFMTPDQEELSAHRTIAQIMVFINERGNGQLGVVEKVAIRFADDWDDWTAVQPNEYILEAEAPKPYKVQIEADGTQPSERAEENMLMSMWEEILSIYVNQCINSAAKSARTFIERVGRALDVFRRDNLVLAAYEVQRVRRVSVTGHHSMPAIRILMYTRSATLKRASERQTVGGETRIDQKTVEGLSGDKGNVEEAQQIDWDHAQAEVLLDISHVGSQIRVKHIAVVYEGEWPLAHHYWNNTPPPTMEGLEALCKV